MNKIEFNFTRKAMVQAAVLGIVFVVLVLFAVSQRVGIGQQYQMVQVNGETVGYVSDSVDVRQAVLEARREVALGSDERLCMELSYETQKDRKLFQKLSSEEELKTAICETITKSIPTESIRAYTVAIDGYHANFTSLSDVETFLNRVKAASDEENQYETKISAYDSHISGILVAQLQATDTADNTEVVPEETLADELLSGVSAASTYALEYALANPDSGEYQTGILDMEFVERVEVYENYVSPDEIADIDEQVTEVTKEKESNKIYVVESGDCLSVIAMDHDTTVSSIMSLNGMSDADAIIRDGQELIIAVPEPDLKIRVTMGEVYEEDYNADAVIIENDSWYTTKEVVHEEGTPGHRERNDVVVYENGSEVSRTLVQENILVESTPAVIERGTIIPPTYIKPLAGGRYTSGFGRRWGRMHKGVDWACPVGTTVYASCAGTVIQAAYSGGYGNVVVISHPDGRMTRYAHNSKLAVKVGQHVEQGETIAYSGSTGRSTGPHVHFELYINGSAVNPLDYISY